jgi:hypothetical protein
VALSAPSFDAVARAWDDLRALRAGRRVFGSGDAVADARADLVALMQHRQDGERRELDDLALWLERRGT